ncbi:hypothetical protein Tco_0905887 [Tanacetum coccineum]
MSGSFSMDSRIIGPCCLFIMYSSIMLFQESYISFHNIGGRLSAAERIALSARVVIEKFMCEYITHPPSPNYVPGPEKLEQAPLSLDYVPEPEYLEYLVPSDDEVPVEDQPLPADASPAALSPGFVADSDPKEDLEEDHKEDPTDYPANGGDEDDNESSNDDDDDDEEEHKASEDDDEEDKDHPTLADSSDVPVDDPIHLVEDIEAFETDESAPTPALIVVVVAALPSSPPPSLLTPLSSPLPQIPSPPLPLPSPPTHTSPTYAEAPLDYKAVGIRLRAASPPTHHLSEIPSPPLFLPSTTYRDDLPKTDMPLRKRACFTTPTSRFEVGKSSSAAARHARQTLAYRVDYGFIDTMDASIRAAKSRAMTAIRVVNETVTNLATTQRQETHELQNILPKRTTATTTPMIDAQIKALKSQGVADALAKHEANRSKNGDDSHDS